MKSFLLTTAIKLLGGIDGIVELAINWFNDNVLAKIKDKTEFAAYAEDVAAFGFFLDGVMNRHVAWMSDEKRAAFAKTITAVDTLAKSLADCKVERQEIDALIDAVSAAIKAWKEAK